MHLQIDQVEGERGEYVFLPLRSFIADQLFQMQIFKIFYLP